MNDSRYRIESASLDDNWIRFIESSNTATIYSHSEFLRATECRLGLYWIYRGGERRGLIYVNESEDGKHVPAEDSIVYSGVVIGSPTTGQQRSQRVSEAFELNSCAAQFLEKRYSRLQLDLPPSISDIRPFIWHNYNNDARKYCVEVRYTANWDISSFAEVSDDKESNAYAETSGSRRQQIRYATRQEIRTEESNDVDILQKLYIQTMERQGLLADQSYLEKMSSIAQGLLKCGKAILFCSYLSDGTIASAGLFGFSNNRHAVYLYGGNNPSSRSSAAGSSLLWEAGKSLSKLGYEAIDLEGANSPKRGWFKTSFGARLECYYRIILK